MRITSCENTFSACNRSSSSRLGTLHRHRHRHHGGGEMSSRRTPSQRPTTQRRTAVPHLHSLRVPPSLRARSQRVPRGVSISTICAKGIVNITHLARLLVEIHFTPRQISRSRRTRLAPNFVCTLRNIPLAATAMYWKSFTGGGFWSVGESLLGCCCWPGAAVGSYGYIGYMHTLLAQEKTFTLHYRDIRKSCESYSIVTNPVRTHLLSHHTRLRAAYLICLFPRQSFCSRCQTCYQVSACTTDDR
jgi:hypothetical protein